MRRRSALKTLVAAPAALPLAAQNPEPWLGPDYWANPLQDWRRTSARAFECHVAGGDRNVYWLTRTLGETGDFAMSVRLAPLDATAAPAPRGWVGFRLGCRTWVNHYKDTAIRGLGLEAGLTHDGTLFITGAPAGPRLPLSGELTLSLTLIGSTLTLSAGGESLRHDLPQPARDFLTGGLMLVCSSVDPLPDLPVIREPNSATEPKRGTARGGAMRFRFTDWQVSGPRVRTHPERAFGPLLFNQFTLSRGVLKMLVQLVPFDSPQPALELRAGGRTVAQASIDPLSSTALLRVDRWDATRATPYEVVFGAHRLTGTIPADPVGKPQVNVGALTCQNDCGFPHAGIARNLAHAQPDILFFTGDQVYERNGEYGIERAPLATARLDYLRKWFLFGWAWGDLTRNIPCVCLADDHDVYHGNIWGAGGRKAEFTPGPEQKGQPQQWGQDSGGYTMPATWVNMVQRTQSAHLPDPPDPTPIDQEITVHYGHLHWGGISFALLEDRKWKTAPRTVLPEALIHNGWPQNPKWDAARQGDVPTAHLLGERQEKFLAAWANDWRDDTIMKCVVSATIFTNLATLPQTALDDSVTQSLAVMPLGGYAPNEKVTMDHDSNAWPQTARTRALRLIRRCLAVHIAGDQHLGSTVQYGVDDFADGPTALCTPAVSNLFPRRWFPPGTTNNLGDFRDGFGNRVTVRAVANPQKFGIAPHAQNERAPGFGWIVFDKPARRITLTNWPRWADLTSPGAQPYPGWPITISQWDNGLSRAGFELKLKKAVSGLVRVIKEGASEPEWVARLAQPLRALPVWTSGDYRIEHHAGHLRRIRATPRRA